MSTRFTPFCMFRLFCDLLPQMPEKILYLDTDVLCCADFSQFYDTDIENVHICGVPDRYGKWFFGGAPFRHDYLNSGVLLMNVGKMKNDEVFLRCRDMCRDKKMFMPDQTALNKTALKKRMPQKFNEQGNLKNDTVFQHFSTKFVFFPVLHTRTVKPWEFDRVREVLKINRYDGLFKKFLKETNQ